MYHAVNIILRLSNQTQGQLFIWDDPALWPVIWAGSAYFFIEFLLCWVDAQPAGLPRNWLLYYLNWNLGKRAAQRTFPHK